MTTWKVLAKRFCAEIDGAEEAVVVEGDVVVSATERTGLLPRIIAVAEAAGYTVTDLSATEPTLETVFINLTGRDLRE